MVFRDNKTRLAFLVDTGANVSVIPKKCVSAKNIYKGDYKLFAANDSEIKTYGISELELSFGLRRSFKWTFIVCDVKQPILGADFLKSII